MRKSLFLIAGLSLILFVSCTRNCKYFEVNEKSWGTEYTWAYVDTNHKITYYTLMQGSYDLGNTFFEKGNLDENLNHSYVKEYKNAEINEIERHGEKITSITVNKKKYTFE